MGTGIIVGAEPEPGMADGAAQVSLAGLVAQPFGCGQRGELGGGQLGPVALPVQVGIHRPGDLPGVGVRPAGRGVAGQGQQDLVFGGEPVHGLLAVCGLLGPRPRGRRGQRERPVGRAECQGGGVGGVQVVVEEPTGGGGRLPAAVERSLLGRVGAQQVMQRVPARVVLGEQARTG